MDQDRVHRRLDFIGAFARVKSSRKQLCYPLPRRLPFEQPKGFVDAYL